MATIYTPTISGGTLALNLNSAAESWHRVTLNQAISAGGISVSNPPGAGTSCLAFVILVPGATPYDVPITAWTGSGLTSVTWSGDYDSTAARLTPTIVRLMSWDQGATWQAQQNASAGVRVQAVTELPASPDVDTVYVLYST
jgi:hypothetical protein